MNDNKLTKQQLRQKLQNKIAQKQSKRSSRHVHKTNKKKVGKQVKAVFNAENSNHIRYATTSLMKDVGQLVKQGIKTPVELNQKLAVKYKYLIDTRFPIYMGVLKGQLSIEMLDMMLQQKDRIDAKLVSEEAASLELGSVFAKKLNVDVEALVKSAEANKAAGMKPKQ